MTVPENSVPRVFISYSWASAEYQREVVSLAGRLRENGVDVVLDVWDLKSGHDKHSFMERSVTDETIDKVLILCDGSYAEKANQRKGGVGDETMVITPEVYGKAQQEKFIPVLMERGTDGEEMMPAYLKSRMYIDLTGGLYSSQFDELLRDIYGVPKWSKPPLGPRPSFLDVDSASAGNAEALVDARKQIDRLRGSISDRDKRSIGRLFLGKYAEAMKGFHRDTYKSPQEFLDDYSATLEYRNTFLDFIQAISGIDSFGSQLSQWLQSLYNDLIRIKSYRANTSSFVPKEFDLLKLHMWELFVCVTAFLLYDERYQDLNELLSCTYYLRKEPFENQEAPTSYTSFRYRSNAMEEYVKPALSEDLSRKITLVGHLMDTKRDYSPIYTGETMANADLFLYQVYNGLGLDGIPMQSAWFPTCYIYSDGNVGLWRRLSSKGFCTRIAPLFGVDDLDELKERIALCVPDDNYAYRHSYGPAPAILNQIRLEAIGTLP